MPLTINSTCIYHECIAQLDEYLSLAYRASQVQGANKETRHYEKEFLQSVIMSIIIEFYLLYTQC